MYINTYTYLYTSGLVLFCRSNKVFHAAAYVRVCLHLMPALFRLIFVYYPFVCIISFGACDYEMIARVNLFFQHFLVEFCFTRFAALRLSPPPRLLWLHFAVVVACNCCPICGRFIFWIYFMGLGCCFKSIFVRIIKITKIIRKFSASMSLIAI